MGIAIPRSILVHYLFGIEIQINSNKKKTTTFHCFLYQVKIVQNTKNNKLRWLASDINFKLLLHTGCPITHDYII